jgi:hypothetical protein
MLSMCIYIFYTHTLYVKYVYLGIQYTVCAWGLNASGGKIFYAPVEQPWGPSGLVSIPGLKWSDYPLSSVTKGWEWIGAISLPPLCACTGISQDDLYLYTAFMFKYI